jgi:hypothetical protein
MRRALLVGSVLVAVLAACHRSVEPPVGPQPVASIQEIMQAFVDPAADTLWEAVSSETTAAGTIDHQPQTDAEWLALRHQALRLAEGATLLPMPGRAVAHVGRALEDSHVLGILDAEQILHRIEADRPAFAAHAQALQLAAQDVLAAIDTRDLRRYNLAGERLDHACESCHLRYWYPDDKRPPELSRR